MAQLDVDNIACGSLHARWWGPADPIETIVLLHGGPRVSQRYMEPVVPFVDNGRRRIVSYDQRGVGLSPCDSDDPADYGLDAHTDDLTRVIDAVAVGPVHLLGHSWGGVLAMDYAARHGDRLASIITVGSAPPNHAAPVRDWDQELLVLVIRIGHRRDIYRRL